jgi:hypothetical protein
MHARAGRRGQSPNSFHDTLVRNILGALRVTEVAGFPGLYTPKHNQQRAYLGITLCGASVQWCRVETRLSQAWTVS